MKKFENYWCNCYVLNIIIKLFQKGLDKKTLIQEKWILLLQETADKFMQSVLSMWKFFSVASALSWFKICGAVAAE